MPHVIPMFYITINGWQIYQFWTGPMVSSRSKSWPFSYRMWTEQPMVCYLLDEQTFHTHVSLQPLHSDWWDKDRLQKWLGQTRDILLHIWKIDGRSRRAHIYYCTQLWWLQNTGHDRWPYTELCSYDNDLAYDLDVSPSEVRRPWLNTFSFIQRAVRLGLGVLYLTYLLVLPTDVLLIR